MTNSNLTAVAKAIEEAKYKATTEQVEQLAFTVTLGLHGRSTYLRVLVAFVQAEAPTKRGQLASLKRAHEHYYPAVLKGVGGMSLEPKERERRGTFARTSLSTLRGFVRGGGNINALDINAVTKGTLRKAAHPEEPAERAERSMSRANAALLRAAKRLAKRQPLRARELLQRAIEALRDVMPAKNAKPQLVRVSGPTKPVEVRTH
jgi:hypothetical protein